MGLEEGGGGKRERDSEREREKSGSFEAFLRAGYNGHFNKFAPKKTPAVGQFGWMDPIIGFLNA